MFPPAPISNWNPSLRGSRVISPCAGKYPAIKRPVDPSGTVRSQSRRFTPERFISDKIPFLHLIYTLFGLRRFTNDRVKILVGGSAL